VREKEREPYFDLALVVFHFVKRNLRGRKEKEKRKRKKKKETSQDFLLMGIFNSLAAVGMSEKKRGEKGETKKGRKSGFFFCP